MTPTEAPPTMAAFDYAIERERTFRDAESLAALRALFARAIERDGWTTDELFSLLYQAREERDSLLAVAEKLHVAIQQAHEADAIAEWFTDTDRDGVDIPFLLGMLPTVVSASEALSHKSNLVEAPMSDIERPAVDSSEEHVREVLAARDEWDASRERPAVDVGAQGPGSKLPTVGVAAGEAETAHGRVHQGAIPTPAPVDVEAFEAALDEYAKDVYAECCGQTSAPADPRWKEPHTIASRATLRALFARAIESVAPVMAERDSAYSQRNRLVGLLARLFPAWLREDPNEPNWPVVIVRLPTGQVSWHITAAERTSVFYFLDPGDEPWDGHDDDEKWKRVREARAIERAPNWMGVTSDQHAPPTMAAFDHAIERDRTFRDAESLNNLRALFARAIERPAVDGSEDHVREVLAARDEWDESRIERALNWMGVTSDQHAPPTMAEVEGLMDALTLFVAGDMEDGLDEASPATLNARAALRALFARAIDRDSLHRDLINWQKAHAKGVEIIISHEGQVARLNAALTAAIEARERAEARNTEAWNLASDLNKNLRERAENAEAECKRLVMAEAEALALVMSHSERGERLNAELAAAKGMLDEIANGFTTTERDRLLAELAAQVAARERAEAERNCETGVLSMTVARLGGKVEGAPTQRLNFLQRIDALREIEAEVSALREERDRLRAALREIRGFDDPWAHRGHEPSEAGHECRMCWIMRTASAALAPPAQEES